MRDVAPAIERNLVACHGIISAVDIHRKAIEFVIINFVEKPSRFLIVISLPRLLTPHHRYKIYNSTREKIA